MWPSQNIFTLGRPDLDVKLWSGFPIPTFLTESPQVSLSIEKNYKLYRYVALYVHTDCSKKVSTKSRPSNLQQPKHLLRVDLASPTYVPFIVGLNGFFYSRPVEILQDAKFEHLLRVKKT